MEQGRRYLKTNADLDKMKDFRVFIIDRAGKRVDISIKQYPEYWGGNFIPRKKGIYRIFAIDESLPMLERPDSSKNVRPIQYLCAAYGVEDDGLYSGAIQRLDLQVGKKDKLIWIVPAIGGNSVPRGTQLRVFYPDNHDEMIAVDKEGVASFLIAGEGLYLIRLDQMEGRVRHRCDYSLQINDD